MKSNDTDRLFYIVVGICTLILLGTLVASTCLFYFVCDFSLGWSILCTSIIVAVTELVYWLTELACWLLLN